MTPEETYMKIGALHQKNKDGAAMIETGTKMMKDSKRDLDRLYAKTKKDDIRKQQAEK